MTDPHPDPDPDPHQPVQNVSVEGGFGYGVIGASLHVFGDGVPVYLLLNRTLRPEADPQWLRDIPSRILDARHAAVPFHGRETELDELRAWRDADPRLAARWLHGPGGSGKTRLAHRFADDCASEGWKVVEAVQGAGTVLPPPGSQDLRTDGCAGLLLLVDYADRWPFGHLAWLLSNEVLHRATTPTRVLFLARSTDSWPAVQALLNDSFAHVSAGALAALPSRSGARLSMFAAARDRFARLYRLPDPEAIAPPLLLDDLDDPDDPELGLTLSLHMAALVAVDAHANGRRPPATMADLTVYLLNREQAHWRRAVGDGSSSAAAPAPVVTPPELMNRTVFTAALTGAQLPHRGARALDVQRIDADTAQLLHDHALLYPPEDPFSPAVLHPLQPDRLAEDFLALTLNGHGTDYPAQAWAGKALTALAPAGRDADPVNLPRTVTMLAAAAARWPHVGSDHLFPLLRAHPRLAVAAGGPALAAVAALPDIDIDLLKRLERMFTTRDAELDVAMAVVAVRLHEHRERTRPGLPYSAVRHSALAVRLAQAGRWEEALDAARTSVAAWRQVTQTNVVMEIHLAESLIQLSSLHAELGHSEEALAASTEAVSITRRRPSRNRVLGTALWLLAGGRSLTPSDLAVALTAHSAALALSNRLTEALAAAEEAVTILRGQRHTERGIAGHLAAGGRRHRQEYLVKALHNCGIWYSAAQRHEEAMAFLQEAADIMRELADANPGEFLPDLLLTESALADALAAAGRTEEAKGLARRTVETVRPLVRHNPAHVPLLLGALSGEHPFELGDVPSEMTEASAQEALELARTMYAQRGVRNDHVSLVGALITLANIRLSEERADEAVALGEEAVGVARSLPRAAEEIPGTLAVALLRLGGTRLAADLTAGPDALPLFAEAVELVRTRVPEHHAMVLESVVNLVSMTGDHEAVLPYAEALVSVRRLPGESAENLARALVTCASELTALGEYEQALAAVEEAEGHFRAAPADDSDMARSERTGVEAIRSTVYCITERYEDALGEAESGISRMRAAPELTGGYLACVLNNSASALVELGRQYETAWERAEESAGMYEAGVLVDEDFEMLNGLAASLSTRGRAESGLGRHTDALATTRLAVELARDTLPTPPRDLLADVLTDFARVRLVAGSEISQARAAAEEAVHLCTADTASRPHLTGTWHHRAALTVRTALAALPPAQE
ncbi:tetratricopeptide repeat protein [Streptomyces sp. NPDC059072]|uniref:tetratricopeptide repeat protein n=1 Tax=Streptomyces sp. NPDC059072 TaxID=3346715 RepID=UPI0036765173